MLGFFGLVQGTGHAGGMPTTWARLMAFKSPLRIPFRLNVKKMFAEDYNIIDIDASDSGFAYEVF